MYSKGFDFIYFLILYNPPVCLISCPRNIMWGSSYTASHWESVEWQLQPWKHSDLLL